MNCVHVYGFIIIANILFKDYSSTKIVDHPDVVGASTCRRWSNYIFILDLTSGFNGLGKENCKTKREKGKNWDLVRYILEVWL